MIMALALLLATPGAAAAQTSPVAVYESVKPSVLRVVCADRQGTAFLWHDSSTAITALHVVSSGRGVRVHTIDGKIIEARVRRATPSLDLAELALEQPVDARPLPAADEEPRIGDEVCLVGHPFPGLLAADGATPMMGWTLACGRVGNRADGWLQVDAPVNPGESGGPLLDARGRVVGVVLRRFRQAEDIAQARSVRWVDALARSAPLDEYSGETEGYARVGWLWRTDKEGRLHHGPSGGAGFRIADSLELGVYSAVNLTKDAGTDGPVGTRHRNSILALSASGRFLLRVGQARYVALRVGLRGGAMWMRSVQQALILDEGDACPGRTEICRTGRSVDVATATDARAWMSPWLGLDVGGVSIAGVVEYLPGDGTVLAGLGLGLEL